MGPPLLSLPHHQQLATQLLATPPLQLFPGGQIWRRTKQLQKGHFAVTIETDAGATFAPTVEGPEALGALLIEPVAATLQALLEQ